MWNFEGSMWWDSESFPLGIFRDVNAASCIWHTHSFIEVAVILSGHGMHETPDADHAVSAGDIFLVAGTQPHRYHDCEHFTVANVMYDAEKLELPNRYLALNPGFQAFFVVEPQIRARQGILHHLRVTLRELAQVSGQLETLEVELTQKSSGYEGAALGHLISLLVYLSRAYQHQVSVSSPNILRMSEVLSLLESRFTEQLTVLELADVAKLSRGHFMRLFTETMGLAPMEYINRLRMNKAGTLLRGTLLPITEVAFQVGYNDSNFFTRQFKKTFQCTPYQYRRAAGGR